MKKVACFLLMACMSFTLYAVDQTLGSWGLVFGEEKEEFLRFGQDEIILMDTLFRSRDFERAENTILIENFDGEAVMLQYHLLSPNALLFIMWSVDDPTESMTLILSRL